MAQRLACEFTEDDKRIDVVYWIDEQGKVAGEAYWHGDDMSASIRDGEFFHPYHGRHYRLHVPAAYIGKSKDAILEVQTWRTLGRVQPKVAMH
jgi:hypothetical protein